MQEPPTPDDIALIKRIAEAQSGALSELYDRYNRLVFSLALAVVGDRATAEEITLDVFVQVWQRASTYHPDKSKVSTWLAAITRHHAIDVLRHRGSRPQSAGGWDHLPPQPTTSPREMEDHVEHSLERERVQAAISKLPPDQQEALALAYFGGYTHHEIASILSQPLGTVKTRIRSAMHKLRDLLKEEDKSG